MVAAIVFTPKPKTPNQTGARNQRQASPNNALSGRTNEARPMQRVPDIVGTVRSTPDLIAVAYSEFISNAEIENMSLCIGRGSYEVHDMYDGETSVDFVSGSSVEVYRPNTDIYADEPYYSVGLAIEDQPYMATRSNSINGQVLAPANRQAFYSNGSIYFEYPNRIRLVTPGSADFTRYFFAGEDIAITAAESAATVATVSYNTDTPYTLRIANPDAELVAKCITAPGLRIESLIIQVLTTWSWSLGEGESRTETQVVSTHNLAGNYHFSKTPYVAGNVLHLPIGGVGSQWTSLQEKLLNRRNFISPGLMRAFIFSTDSSDYGGRFQIQALEADRVLLVDPGAYNEAWRNLEFAENRRSPNIYGSIYSDIARWSDTFILENPDLTEVWCNFVSPNGLYKDNGENQFAANVSVELELTPVDKSNAPRGDSEYFSVTLYGSSIDRDQKAVTLKAVPTFTGRCRGRARRTSPTDKSFSGTVVDEVKFRDAYSMTPFPFTNFGDFTIVRARTVATTNALALKERKLNCEVTRLLPRRVEGSAFTEGLYPTRSFADILAHVSLDPYIGNRQATDLDLNNIYQTASEIEAYFGTPLAAEFCHTFDDLDTSYEETILMICGAVFCEAYRRGQVLKVFFERETEMSTLLFNHRNKIPGTETRTVSFGLPSDHDGLEYSYASPEDGAVVTLYIPEDRSAVNPEKAESVGVRNRVQAHLNAYRIWQKMRHEHIAVEFDATAEGSLLARHQRILGFASSILQGFTAFCFGYPLAQCFLSLIPNSSQIWR